MRDFSFNTTHTYHTHTTYTFAAVVVLWRNLSDPLLLSRARESRNESESESLRAERRIGTNECAVWTERVLSSTSAGEMCA